MNLRRFTSLYKITNILIETFKIYSSQWNVQKMRFSKIKSQNEINFTLWQWISFAVKFTWNISLTKITAQNVIYWSHFKIQNMFKKKDLCQFEDTKEVIRRRNSKERQYKCAKRKRKTDNDRQNTTNKRLRNLEVNWKVSSSEQLNPHSK